MRRRDNSGQVLIMGLWILVVLSILTISIAQRASLALKISRREKEGLEALYLAKAALNRAISKVDQSDFTAQEGVTVIDEEQKININTADDHLLAALMETYQINDPAQTANSILIWRGGLPDDGNIYESYPAKGKKFTNIQELVLVKGITLEDFQKIKNSITVYGEGLININTAPEEVLHVLAASGAKKLFLQESFARSLIEKLIVLRSSRGTYFINADEIDLALATEELNIFNELLKQVIFVSENFFIAVKESASKIEPRISAVYNRKEKKILYWHET